MVQACPHLGNRCPIKKGHPRGNQVSGELNVDENSNQLHDLLQKQKSALEEDRKRRDEDCKLTQADISRLLQQAQGSG